MNAALETSYPSPPPLAAVASEGTPGATTGAVRILLRLEAGAVLGLSLLAFARLGGSWSLFAALFLLPDLSMLGYLAGPRIGARTYNAAHTYLAPTGLALAGLPLGPSGLIGPALVWAAHIAFDRLLGYGLKYDRAFGATHLGWTGGAAARRPGADPAGLSNRLGAALRERPRRP